MTPQLLTVQELADLCGVKVSTVYTWNSKGTGPKITRLGRSRSVRYRQNDVQAWLAESETNNEDDRTASA